MNIRVIDYQSSWQEDYLKEALQIKEALGDVCINTFHMGSTSVENLAAKPIIDIMVVVNDLGALDELNQIFESMGYEVMGEFGISNRRYYRKGGDHRTHQIHAFQYTNLIEIERHLLFRDYLREHPLDCQRYGDLKKELALQFPTDIDQYGDGKEALVREIEKKALQWHYSRRK